MKRRSPIPSVTMATQYDLSSGTPYIPNSSSVAQSLRHSGPTRRRRLTDISKQPDNLKGPHHVSRDIDFRANKRLRVQLGVVSRAWFSFGVTRHGVGFDHHHRFGPERDAPLFASMVGSFGKNTQISLNTQLHARPMTTQLTDPLN
jgi:hypothetical protein